MRLTIRNRSTVYFSFLVAFFLVAFSAVLMTAVSSSLHRDFRTRLVRDSEILAELFKEEWRLNALNEFREEAAELGLTLRVLDHRGAVVFQSRLWSQHLTGLAPTRLADPAQHVWSSVNVSGVPHQVLSRTVTVDQHPPFLLQVAEREETLATVRRQMLVWCVVLIPLMIAISVLAGVLFSKKALAPVQALQVRANALRADELSARIPMPDIRDELYDLTDTLNRALARIEEAFAQMKAFTADASHELRVPLTAMRGTLEVALRKDRTPEEYRTALKESLEEAERLSHITSDLLALARADSGEPARHAVSVDLRSFLEKFLTQAHSLYPDAVINAGPPPDGAATFDPDQVQRVLLNLIDNALRHGPPKGPVDLEAATFLDGLRFLVRDRGPGIPAEHKDRIFDRFYRIDKARSRAAGGSGLGLAIAAAIAKAHRGSLRVKNTSPGGTVFEFSLPLETSNPALKLP